MSYTQPTGIVGFEGRESFGAALTVGIKGPKGNPVDKDRFYIVWPEENADGVRPRHPNFRVFNEADPTVRRMVLGMLVHPTRDECFQYQYKCQVAKGKPTHPNRVPFCVGNGAQAKRYMGAKDGEHIFAPIACPAERCEFRQGERAQCKPWMRFAFRLCWSKEGMPTPLSKYTSQSWNTIKSFVGFFDRIDSVARSLGFTDYSLMGFRFALSLNEKSNAAMKTRFPTVSITPIDDPVAFFMAQLDTRARIAGRQPIAALTDREQMDPRAQAADYHAHVPGRGQGDGTEEE